MVFFINQINELKTREDFESFANYLCAMKKRDLITADEYKATRHYLVERAFGMFVLG